MLKDTTRNDAAIPMGNDLELLLAEGVDAAKAREASAFDSAAHPYGGEIVLFGAGNLGRATAAGLRAAGIEPRAFVDNERSKWNTTVDGIIVHSPADAAALYGSRATFVVTIWGASNKDLMSERIAQLVSIGCERVVPFGLLFWKYPNELLPYYSADLPHKVLQESDAVREAFDLWADSDSKVEYVQQLKWRLFLDFDAVTHFVSHQPYFPTDLCTVTENEVFVDCGSYDGDTISIFLAKCRSSFKKVVAFEPDPVNYERLTSKVNDSFGNLREKMVTFRNATGARSERLTMVADGSVASYITEKPSANSIEVQSIALDDVVYDDAPTYIKMDVEGFELESLKGAARIIRDRAPVMAICSYHIQNHLWEIPRLIKSFNPDYSFFLRPHEAEIWDLICYAIPNRRLVKNIP